jgi:Mrp family chromosome partitioning ATPase
MLANCGHNPRTRVSRPAMPRPSISRHDLVVIDTPPLTVVSDAFPLLGKVDGVVIVGRVGRNRRDVAERMHQTLAGAGAPLPGTCAGVPERRDREARCLV